MPVFDFSQFDIYGLDYKTVKGDLFVKPRLTRSNKPSKRWSKATSNRGKSILNYATAGDITLLYEDLPNRVLDEFGYYGLIRSGPTTGEALQKAIQPYVDNNRLILNIKINGEYRRFDVAKVITKDTKKSEYFKMAHTLGRIWEDTDYHDGSDIIIQIILLPRDNPRVEGVRDGRFNCVILPVIILLKKRKQSKINQYRINKLLELHEEVKDTGLNNEGIKQVSNIAKINIALYDYTGKVWHKFIFNDKAKTLLLDVHNRHAEVRNDEVLLNQVNSTQKKTSYEPVLAEPINLELFNEQEVKWVSAEELEHLIKFDMTGNIIRSKGVPKALITPTIIYKVPFDEHNKYPEAFTDGGVGKAKFLEQNPCFKNPLPVSKVLWEADRSGFYMRTGKSHRNNIKFDMNHAYKSFKNSGCFKGFPSNIDYLFKFKTGTTASETKTFQYHGLYFIIYPKLNIDQLKTKTNNTYPRIYYECSGWYPIEIVEENYNLYGIDPIVKAIALAEDTFDIDVSKFSNKQFRAFVGKTTSKYVSETWRTTDENEYLRALYHLQDRIVGVSEHTVETGRMIGKWQESAIKSYSIEYTSDKTPWQCPVVGVYVKAHQKHSLFKQYNKLVDNGILPRYISVDGIEISGNQSKKAVPLFSNSGDTPVWKQEEIKISSFHRIDVIERTIPDTKYFESLPLISNYKPLPKLLHLAGSGGNGKTQMVVNMALTNKNICYTATTHNACSELEIRGKKLNISIKAETYHRVFGINTNYPQIPSHCSTFVVEEASMLPDEHLKIIDTRLRDHFNSDKPFGGKRVILVGDFCQLPVLSPLTPLYDPWTKSKTDLYSQFTVQVLEQNYRQSKDAPFYELCQKLREPMSKREAYGIINKLNERVVPLKKQAHTINDLYMAGVNLQCDEINKSKYNGFQKGTKIINSKTFTHKGIKIPNGRMGVVVESQSKKFVVDFQGMPRITFKKKRDEFKHAYAVTVHKAQGRTLTGNVIINPTRLFDKNHLYVALTRAVEFKNVYLTDFITLKIFSKTCFVKGITRIRKDKDIPPRIKAMVKRYRIEEPRLTPALLIGMRKKQQNQCCYCSQLMCDDFGYENSITLERINNKTPHVLENITLACFKCNSAHVGQSN